MDDRQVNVVMRTTEYEKFKHLIGNRAFEGRPEKIIKSIKQNGYIMNPIVVNEKYEVIDGQARLEAEKRLQIPVDYIVVKGLKIEDCVALNAQSTPWTTKNYVDSFVSLGNVNYIRLDRLVKCHEPGVTTIINITKGLYGSARKNKECGISAIKDGSLILSQEECDRANGKLSYIDKFAPVFKRIGGSFTYWALAIAFCYDLPEVDLDRLYTQVIRMENELHPAATIISAITDLEYVYNFKCRARVYFSTEYDKAMREKAKGYAERWGNKK